MTMAVQLRLYAYLIRESFAQVQEIFQTAHTVLAPV